MAILVGLDISADQLQDEAYRLSLEQHEGFILRVLELTDNPHYAIRLAQSYDPGTANIALLGIANSGKISNALHTITRYHKVVTRVFSIRSFEVDNQVIMEIESHLQHRSVTCFALSSLVLMLDKPVRQANPQPRLAQSRSCRSNTRNLRGC